MYPADLKFRQILTSAWDAALLAADPAAALDGTFPPAGNGRLVIIALGKAALAMARAALTHYAAASVPVTGAVAGPGLETGLLGPLTVHRGGHPVPDQDSVRAGETVLQAVHGLTASDLVLVLLSGGASACATVPDGIGLEDLQELNRQLLASGAAISEFNTVRRKLCRLKGGGLARAAAPAQVRALAVSDVVGDDPAVIGSGPVSPDPDSAVDALAVLRRLGIGPAAVLDRLHQLAGQPVPPFPAVAGTTVIASAAASLEAAAGVLRRYGFTTRSLGAGIGGDSAAAAREQAALLRQGSGQPLALVSGGETSVRLPPDSQGHGGRNTHFALSLAVELWDRPGLAALCADTDGIDGSSDAAGAFITPQLFRQASRAEAERALRRNDSAGFFRRHGHLLETGPTGTNVNDLRLILLDSE